MFKKIRPQELVDFANNLAVMLKSGIALNEALATLAEQVRRKRFKLIVLRLRADVETGTSLASALEKEKNIFGKILVSLVKAGESSGTLEENLSFMANWLEANNDLKKEVKAATLYPKIVFLSAVLLGFALAVFVLPKLTPIFEQLRLELPLITRALLYSVAFLKKFWFLILLAVSILAAVFVLLNKLKPIRYFLESLYFRLPFFGKLLINYYLALICHLLFTLFKSGISLNEAIETVSEGTTNSHYKLSLEKAKLEVNQGTALSKVLNGFERLYPKNLINIIASGEKSGTLETSFNYLSQFYSKEVRNKTKKLPVVVEPLLLICIGLAVGLVAIAIILPIYSLTRGLTP